MDPAILRHTVTRGAIEKGAGQVLSMGLDAAIVSTDRPPVNGVSMVLGVLTGAVLTVLRKYTWALAVQVPGAPRAGLWR